MSCSNCFNGCAEIVSDKCVKYTGIDIPGLGIANGDTLLTVENKITEKILGLMTGEGIIPVIDPTVICDLVSDFLPYCPPFTLNDVLTAFVKAICVLDERLIDAENQLEALQESYDVRCLVGVDESSDIHDVLQAVIEKVCEVSTDLIAFKEDVEKTYVKKADVKVIVEEVIAEVPSAEKNFSKMVPFIVYPFYGDIAKFGTTGVGTDEWINVYLCNGLNGTPDMRGRVPVGTTDMSSVAMDAEVTPSAGNFPNPAYAKGDKAGANDAFITDITQMPKHKHLTTVTITDPKHAHTGVGSSGDAGEPYGYLPLLYVPESGPTYTTDLKETGLKGNGNGPNPNVVVDISETGGGATTGHANIQPVRALYFIMYKP